MYMYTHIYTWRERDIIHTFLRKPMFDWKTAEPDAGASACPYRLSWPRASPCGGLGPGLYINICIYIYIHKYIYIYREREREREREMYVYTHTYVYIYIYIYIYSCCFSESPPASGVRIRKRASERGGNITYNVYIMYSPKRKYICIYIYIYAIYVCIHIYIYIYIYNKLCHNKML